MKNQRPLLAYFGHHKCASSWIIDVLNDAASIMNLEMLCYNPGRAWDEENDREQLLRSISTTDLLCMRNADIRTVKYLPHFRGFHVVRDPRDLLVSAYFSHLYSHPVRSKAAPMARFADQREKLKQVDQTTGLLLEFDFCAKYLSDIATWNYAQPNVLEVRYEDLTRDPYEKFTEIFQFLGLLQHDRQHNMTLDRLQLAASSRRHAWMQKIRVSDSRMQANATNPLLKKMWLGFRQYTYRHLHKTVHSRYITPEALFSITERHSFQKKTGGRQKGTERQQHHYRKGVAGDWRNYFEPAHITEFKRRYNDVLLKLGYETDPDWQ